MSATIPNLREALIALEEVWADAEDVTALSREQLIAANDAIGMMRRRLDALHVHVAAGIADESRAELGSDNLVKQHGYRNAGALIAGTTGVSAGEANRLVKVGEATAARSNLVGESLPAKYPAVRAGLDAGSLTVAVAAALIALLDRVRLKTDESRVIEAERLLAEQVQGLALDDVRRLLTRAEAWLDPDGIAPREEDVRAHRNRTPHGRGWRSDPLGMRYGERDPRLRAREAVVHPCPAACAGRTRRRMRHVRASS